MSKELTAAVVATGDELTLGKVADRNGGLLAAELTALGFRVKLIILVGDCADEIASALQHAVQHSELVITTGGLGPTTDDITRNVIAAVCGLPIELRDASLEKLKAWAAKRNRPFNETNARQAYFPRGAEILDNSAGTADAFCTMHASGVPIVALPGVPSELRVLIQEQLKDWISRHFDLPQPPASSVLKLFGLSESYIGSLIEGADLGPEINVAYRPHFPEVWITLSSRWGGEPDAARDQVTRAAQKVRNAIGEQFIFSTVIEESFSAVVGRCLKEKGMKLSVAESCTGGRISDLIVSIPGASEFFNAGLVTYANESKENFLGVHAQILEHYGAVSRETALDLARGARIRSGAEIGLATTGIAGPTGGSEAKPVGTVWIALSAKQRDEAFCYHLNWDRERFRQYASYLALDLVRRHLRGLPLEWERR